MVPFDMTEGLEIGTWTGRPYNSVVSLNHGERERDGESVCVFKQKQVGGLGDQKRNLDAWPGHSCI